MLWYIFISKNCILLFCIIRESNAYVDYSSTNIFQFNWNYKGILITMIKHHWGQYWVSHNTFLIVHYKLSLAFQLKYYCLYSSAFKLFRNCSGINISHSILSQTFLCKDKGNHTKWKETNRIICYNVSTFIKILFKMGTLLGQIYMFQPIIDKPAKKNR